MVEGTLTQSSSKLIYSKGDQLQSETMECLKPLFAGSLRSGQRAANIMALIQTAKLNGLDPSAYLSDVLKRLPTHKMKDIEELLPHNWQALENQ